MTYQIIINGLTVKEYPTREQCNAWLHMKGYIKQSRYGLQLDEGVRIDENN